MKRKDLIRQLEAGGCVLIRHGGKARLVSESHHEHLSTLFLDITEINEHLAKRILKMLLGE